LSLLSKFDRHHLQSDSFSVVAEIDKSGVGARWSGVGGRWLLEEQAAMFDDVA
jgi:hypothetical protein